MTPSLKLILGICSTVLIACNTTTTETKTPVKKDTVVIPVKDSVKVETATTNCTNDSLNAVANIMSGISDSNPLFKDIQSSTDFKVFSKNFDKRWMAFDSSRLSNLRKFKDEEISKIVKTQPTLFYPFSGPDILYSQTFFPDVDKYVMIGLEPVGSLPEFNQKEKDSLDTYFSKVNTSLNAILKFSFFRTQSMSKDLRNEEVDGTLHLLVLFLKRTGNTLCSAKPVTVDSTGTIKYIATFSGLKKLKANTKGVEITFTDVNHHPKTLYYFSLNASDGGLKSNKGFVAYLKNMGPINSYLKGASYLMHKNYFSIIRNTILNQSQHVIQDDSGMAFHYFTESDGKWNYSFYGKYLKPIPMFSQFYQPDLDSLYKLHHARGVTKPIGFGIGYNFKDKNSNFMIASKQR